MTEPTQGSTPEAGGPAASLGQRLKRPAQVLVVSSVMFTFISYWRTAAVVLCDLASTAYYIGGIVEASIGPAAPFFILAVMLFSYAVRSVYIESCSLFVRGGVYRVVKEAMGGFLGKLSVSALMFDYILTGPTSGVSAGQYLMGLAFQTLKILNPGTYQALGLGDDKLRDFYSRWGSVLIASLITLYFFRQNLLGIHESSEKALKIMIATTIMAVIMLSWCLITLAVNGPANELTWKPDLDRKYELQTRTVKDPDTGEEREEWIRDPRTGRLLPKLEHGYKEIRDEQGRIIGYEPVDPNDQPVEKMSEALGKVGIETQEDPIGWLAVILPKQLAEQLRQPRNWLSIIGMVGLMLAFGHSILAMSGEETLAQVYREVESPKMPNFKKAAFIVFVYSLCLTAGISFLAVILIPDTIRMKDYSGNLIGGLARYVLGPPIVKLFLEGFVVIVGFLILSGAVNTAIIGSNGVLNRVAEDGVLPDWFLRPHPKYGTTYRLLYLITGMQLAVIIFSGGDMIVLGEAYAFGVVWSFVFKALAMVVLRFKDKSPREFKVPLNMKIAGVEIPFGLLLIFFTLLGAAVLNFFTKEVATVAGMSFTIIFLVTFMVSEHYHEKKRIAAGAPHAHMEQFNKEVRPDISLPGLGLHRPYRKLVSIRSTLNLFMLEKALAETDPETTDMIVMTAKVLPPGGSTQISDADDLDSYDQKLMTAVVERAEQAGKEVKPLIVPTNNPLHAILNTAKDLQVQELVMGGSNKYTVDEQLEQIAFYWISLHGGNPPPLTVRILTRERDMALDLGGGSRIPKISERRARTVAELRAAGVGVDRVLLGHDGSSGNSDLFQAVLTMLDPEVVLGILPLRNGEEALNYTVIRNDEMRAKQIGRELRTLHLTRGDGPEIVEAAQKDQFDLIILPLPPESPSDPIGHLDDVGRYVLRHAHCRVLLAVAQAIPTEVVDQTPSAG
jgi:amino acid transporter/nucleotide-binding universal stress UspA family protein